MPADLSVHGSGITSKQHRCIAVFTVFFAVFSTVFVLLLHLINRAPIYVYDGFTQHYTVLSYIRRSFEDLFTGKGLHLFDFSLGQGLDVLTTLTYYGVTDPINLLAAFFPQNSMVAAYYVTELTRTYLTGLAFIAYTRFIGVKDDKAVFFAALIFTFCKYSTYMLIRHPYFENGLLYLCLILLGIELILQQRRWFAFALCVGLMLWVNFYFAFINTVIAIIYILVRLLFRYRQRLLRGSIKDGFTLLGTYLLGVLLSGAVFVPVLLAFKDNGRLGEASGYNGSLLHYSLLHYLNLFANEFSYAQPGTYLPRIAPLSFFALAMIPLKRDKTSRQFKVALLLCTTGLCVPLFGKLTNGLSYVSDRWSYAFSLFLALGCAQGLTDLFAPENIKPRRLASLIALAYAFVAAALHITVLRSSAVALIDPAILVVTALVLFFWKPSRFVFPERAKTVFCVSLAAMILFGVVADLTLNSYSSTELMHSDVIAVYENETVAADIDDEGVYRVDQKIHPDSHAALQGYLGTSFYLSLLPSHITGYYSALGLPSQLMMHCLVDIGSGADMNAVAGVKYALISPEYLNMSIPYGFERVEDMASQNENYFEVYKNDFTVPLGYTFDSAMSESEYSSLPVYAKMQALTSCAIADETGLPEAEFFDLAYEIPFEIASTDSALLLSNCLQFEKDGSIEITYRAESDSETWLIVEEPEVDCKTEYDVYTYSRRSTGVIEPRSSSFYFKRPVLAICLGQSEGLATTTVICRNDARFSYSSVRLFSIPLEAYRTKVARLQAEPLEDISLSNDHLSGRIKVSGKRLLQIAIPYSKGWTARVDGVETPLFRSGGMYMGVIINEGEHTLELSYFTPGLKTGIVMTLSGAVICVVILYISYRRKRKRSS